MTRPAPPAPAPIASLFPPGRLPTHDRARSDWRFRPPRAPRPLRYPPRAAGVAASFHHFALIHLLERSCAALARRDDTAARRHAEAAASLYAAFMHGAHPRPWRARDFVEHHLGQILIAPFRRPVGDPFEFRQRRPRARYGVPLAELFGDTLRRRARGAQPFRYRHARTSASPFEELLRARVHARQRFFHPEPDNPFDRPYRLLRITYPSPGADTADPIDRYIRDFHDRVPF